MLKDAGPAAGALAFSTPYGRMMTMPTVRCTVSNCYFWDAQNVCGADEILIVSNRITKLDDDSMEVADIGYTPVAVSSDTCCKTFRPSSEHKDKGRSG